MSIFNFRTTSPNCTVLLSLNLAIYTYYTLYRCTILGSCMVMQVRSAYIIPRGMYRGARVNPSLLSARASAYLIRTQEDTTYIIYILQYNSTIEGHAGARILVWDQAWNQTRMRSRLTLNIIILIIKLCYKCIIIVYIYLFT